MSIKVKMQLVSMISAKSGQELDSFEIDRIESLVDTAINVATQNQANNFVNAKIIDSLLMFMKEGTRKIEAIKEYRSLTGLPLKEAKDAVEKYWTSQLTS